MSSGADLGPVLTGLLCVPLTVDVVNALADGPATFRTLRVRLRVRPRNLDDALRMLAAHEVIRRRDHYGSWDRPAPADARCELTETGWELACQLERCVVWVAIYDYYLRRPA
jgi:DNA-binding HxlR family transcriptional regulator